MPNSTRRGRSGRVDVIEVFSPRRSGPWHLLRPLRTRFGFVVLVIVVLVLLVRHQLPVAMTLAAVYLVLLLLSFSAVWQLAGLLIRSRAELTVLGGIAGADLGLRSILADNWAALVLLGALAALGLLPVTGRYLGARFWCVVDRHRLRLCLRQTKVRTMNMDGSLPLLLWARPTKIGERVWVWVRAGSSAEDIADAVEYIAPACYAREARIHRVRKLTTIVGIDIIRRDPLADPTPVASPLARLTALVTGAMTAEGTDSVRAATIGEITATEATPAKPGRPSKITKTVPSSAPVETPLVVSGEDLSDYIDG